MRKRNEKWKKKWSVLSCIIRLTEKWKHCLNRGLVFGVLLTNLLKAFDCLPHESLAVKLNAYELETSNVCLIFDYLTNRKQQTKIDCLYSSWKKLLGTLFFSIAVFDLFNRDLNRGCLVYMFSLHFSGSNFLINLRQQFRVHKIFSCTQNFPYTSFLRGLQSFHFVFKITVPKVHKLCFRLSFH